MKKSPIFFLFLLLSVNLFGQEKEYKIWQFPKDRIPVIDGDDNDWKDIPESYVITIDDMKEDEGKHAKPDKSTLDIRVKVGWCAELNRLYFLYEAYDNYWHFSENSLSTDIFEVVVDGDRSGGPFIDKFHPDPKADVWQRWFNFHGCQAQNYHIFTPPHGDEWCMLWGPQLWLKEKPYADYAYQYSFKEGESGWLKLEFYITPFDHADASGPAKSIPSVLKENEIIGLSWAVIDYDANPNNKDGFWNLSDEHTMYGNASYLRPFRLMPLESQTDLIRIACVGNSITEGIASSDRVNKSYVGLLRDMMQSTHDVRNFGLSGTTICRHTYKPYDECDRFEQAKSFQPHIVTIALGTNDTQPRVWNEGSFAENLEKDLIYLCEAFENLESKPTIYLCLPIPIIPSERWAHQPEVLSEEIIPIIRKVAEAKGYGLIDLHTPLLGKKECYPSNDMLHPNDLGHKHIAELIYKVIAP